MKKMNKEIKNSLKQIIRFAKNGKGEYKRIHSAIENVIKWLNESVFEAHFLIFEEWDGEEYEEITYDYTVTMEYSNNYFELHSVEGSNFKYERDTDSSYERKSLNEVTNEIYTYLKDYSSKKSNESVRIRWWSKQLKKFTFFELS